MEDSYSNNFFNKAINDLIPRDLFIDYHDGNHILWSDLIVYSLAGAPLYDVYEKVKVSGISDKTIVVASKQAIRILMGVKNSYEIYFMPENTSLDKLTSPFLANKSFIIKNTAIQRLNPFEEVTIELICSGVPVSKISKVLGKSPKTISSYKVSAMKKLGVFSYVELHYKVNIMKLCRGGL